jgi:hypothetical protein
LLRAWIFLALLVPAVAHAADPTVTACLSSSERAIQLRARHELRAARAELLQCAAASCPGEIRQECAVQVDKVTLAIPTLVFAVKNVAGKELSAVRVSMDGHVIAEQLEGIALELDPGEHEFRFEVAGEIPVTERLILHEGEKDRRETVAVGPVLGARVPTPPQLPSTTAPAEVRPRRRLLGLGVGVVGVVGLGIGAAFGAVASSKWDTAVSECPSHTGCSPQAINNRDTAATAASVSTVGLIAGGVLAAAGVVIFLTAPRAAAPGVGLQVGPSAVVLTSGF